MKKMKLLIVYLILIGSIGCVGEKSSDEISLNLIDKLLSNESVKALSQSGGELVILKIGYCEKNNCEEYFSSNNQGVKLYSKKEAFMRGYRNVVIIEDMKIESENSYIELKIRNNEGEKRERIEF